MTHPFNRISSTQLNNFASCHRLWAFIHASGEDSGVGYSAAVGTVVHACLEHRMFHGELPTYEQVLAMDGNYERPGESLRRYHNKGIWGEALDTAEGVGDPWQHIPEEYAEVIPEKNMEDWGLALDGVALGGYIDVFAVNEDTNTALLFDWKTRGKTSWKFRPSRAELPHNRQLLYYASVVRAALGVDAIDVYHGNILRAGDGGPAVEIVGGRILGHEADNFLRDLRVDTLPRMHAVHSLWGSGKRGQVEGDRSNCFQYGPCKQMSRCNALDGAQGHRHALDRIAAEGDAL